MTTATKTGNPVERIKAEKPGLDILDEIHELAAQHGGWETMTPATVSGSSGLAPSSASPLQDAS